MRLCACAPVRLCLPLCTLYVRAVVRARVCVCVANICSRARAHTPRHAHTRAHARTRAHPRTHAHPHARGARVHTRAGAEQGPGGGGREADPRQDGGPELSLPRPPVRSSVRLRCSMQGEQLFSQSENVFQVQRVGFDGAWCSVVYADMLVIRDPFVVRCGGPGHLPATEF